MGRLVSTLALVLAGAACLPGGAQAAFGLDEFDASFAGEDGSPAMAAGSHPFAFTTSLKMNASGGEVEGQLRELFLDEPPGLIVAPSSVPRCNDEDFETLNEGRNDCPDSSAVGIFEYASGDPADWTTAPVFNLVPPTGVLMRLGFRLGGANAIVDFALSPQPPYRLLATVSEIPEAAELFAARLQLWGVPASSSHDGLRGRCAPDGVIGSCPSVSPQVPLLTLPTSCEGPQETFYEALSWEGSEDSGAAITHDSGENPLGFSDCGNLAFDPFASVHPTTAAAQSPTGLDISLAFADEGLASEGIAESQIRDVAFSLSGGMTTSPELASPAGSCSEAALEAETLESAGCPPTSNVGTAEVKSPLLEGQAIHGAIYRATPNENFASDAPVALYVVLKDSGLGVSIAQPVALEADPVSGELIAFAEDMPQLPFSELHLHLVDGEGGPLIGPPQCGKYRAEMALEPWAWEGPFSTLSEFEIVSGAGGGPCPSDARVRYSETQPSVGDGSPLVANGLAASRHRVSHKHRCRKGRHRVRRHGKTRCAVGRHRKHRVGAR